MFRLLAIIFIAILVTYSSCDDPEGRKPPGIISLVDSVSYKVGTLIYSGDQAKNFWTEFNTSIRKTESGQSPGTLLSIDRIAGNPALKCSFNAGDGNQFSGIKMAVYKTEFDTEPLPSEIASVMTGFSFNAIAFKVPMVLRVDAIDIAGKVIKTSRVKLRQDTIATFKIDITNQKLKRIDFKVVQSDQVNLAGQNAFAIDDVYLTDASMSPFVPPASDAVFLQWLKKASLRFFQCNFKTTGGNRGVVVESWTDQKKVSLSGLGYAYAAFLIMKNDGDISSAEAKEKIMAMLTWQYAQNWFDGTAGTHGFPYHYFNLDGSGLSKDASTIDWAMCAAGLRVVRQHYHNDAQIVTLINELLARPDWSAAIDANKKIVMGFDGNTGNANNYRWGLSFSEETELVYLEAVASGDLKPVIFESITRIRKNGFYPSWFGAGFTYNWLQLWTGVREPYKTNSASAFEADHKTSQAVFGRPVMGLTACLTLTDHDENGFLRWSRYISNQGSNVHGTSINSEVIQISPATYGAVLALPFKSDLAIASLRDVVSLGYYHPYLGLPDNVRLSDLPEGVSASPNWDTFDINIGPQALAIEMLQKNLIASLYLHDPDIAVAFDALVSSFEF